MSIKFKLIPKGKTQVCKNTECIWFDVSQQVKVTIQGKQVNYKLKACTGCNGKLILDDESNYEA